jgi:hypothetical protein
MKALWTVRDRAGHRMKRGDWVLLDGELVSLTYVTPRKIIVRKKDRLIELKPGHTVGASAIWLRCTRMLAGPRSCIGACRGYPLVTGGAKQTERYCYERSKRKHKGCA